MRISFNPSNVEAILTPPDNKDILFDLAGHNIFARGVKFYGTDTNTWRPIVDNLTSDSKIWSLSANLGRILNLTKTPYNNTTTASGTPSASNIVICPTNTSYYSSLGIPDGGGGLLIRGNTGTAFDLWLHDTSNVWYKRTSTGAWKKMDAGKADYSTYATALKSTGDDGSWYNFTVWENGYFWLRAGTDIYKSNTSYKTAVDYATNAGTASNADKIDGYHANGLFTNLGSSGGSILSVTIGGTTKSLGQFQREGSSLLWINGRLGALLRETTASGYHSIWSMKTSSGSWEFGEFNTSGYLNIPLLTYITDANYNNKNNSCTYQIKFPLASGTVALTSNIPTALKNPLSLTTFGVVYDGSAAKVVTPVNFVSLLTEGTSTITDGTMLITSYASNNGFADSNAVNTPYKRKAIHLWNYIKSKTDSLYATVGHNHDGRYVRYYAVTSLDCNSLANGFTAAKTTASNSANNNHSAFLYVSDVGTPFLLQFPDSSNFYIYKRYKSGSSWSGWSKLSAGYADSAALLTTARKINGTAFNGTVDITTAYWGTTRNITIGNTTKEVNGSGNVSWSLSEIGLGAYLPLAGGTMTNTAYITWADSGSWGAGTGAKGAIGGLKWSGQSDYAWLYAEETTGDNLDLVMRFGDDNSNGLSIRNASNTQTTYISASGTIRTIHLDTLTAFFHPGNDSTLKLYSGKTEDGKSDGHIALQTSIDGTDGQTHVYPTQYGSRCVLALQPRGGSVYIGSLPNGGGSHKLNVNGSCYATSYSVSSMSSLYQANDCSPKVGDKLGNLVIQTWYGVSFTSNCCGTYKGTTAVGIDAREGVIRAANYEGKWQGYVNNLSTNNTTDTWVPVLNGSTLYHRVIPTAYNSDPSTLNVNTARYLRTSKFGHGPDSNSWHKIMTFTTNWVGLVTFMYAPEECQRNYWFIANINVRSNNLLFYIVSCTGVYPTMKCIGDNNSWELWIKGNTQSYDPYGAMSLLSMSNASVSAYGYIIASQSSEPSSTYNAYPTNAFRANSAASADTATKLINSRKIWGLSFNGTADVNNTLRITLTTGNYCEGIRILTTDSSWATIVLGATGDTGTNTNAWSIHRKSDNNFAISRNSSDGKNGLVMTSTGMGLGTTSPGYRLDVSGSARITSQLFMPINGNYQAILMGDDCWLGDCNIGNVIGLSGTTNANAGGIKFGKGGMYIGYNGSNHYASSTSVWSSFNADMVDGYHANLLAKAWSASSTTMNLVAQYNGNYFGMITGTGSSGFPNSDGNWTHVFQASYNNNSGGDESSGNFWITQIANRAGTTSPWIRSRSGGNDITTGWTNWVRIMTKNDIDGYYWANVKISTSSSTNTAPTFGSMTWGTWSDMWSDGTDKHPWYGYNHGSQTNAYHSVLSDYLGMTLKTANTLRLDFGTLLINGTSIYDINVASSTKASKLSPGRNLWGNFFDGTKDITGLITLNSGYHSGIRISNTYIDAIEQALIIHNNSGGIRFGNDAWDWNQWAGLKYVHSSKTIYLGLADGSVFTANSAQSGGTINLQPGISTLKVPNTINSSASEVHFGCSNSYSDPYSGLSVNFKLGGTVAAKDIYSNGGFHKNGSDNNYVLLGGGGHSKISDLSVSYANNSDKLDGIHASGLFTNLSNSGNNLSITVGGTNKTLTVGYASKAGAVAWSNVTDKPRLYWADVLVSTSSNTQTTPTFKYLNVTNGSRTIKALSIDSDNNLIIGEDTSYTSPYVSTYMRGYKLYFQVFQSTSVKNYRAVQIDSTLVTINNNLVTNSDNYIGNNISSTSSTISSFPRMYVGNNTNYALKSSTASDTIKTYNATFIFNSSSSLVSAYKNTNILVNSNNNIYITVEGTMYEAVYYVSSNYLYVAATKRFSSNATTSVNLNFYITVYSQSLENYTNRASYNHLNVNPTDITVQTNGAFVLYKNAEFRSNFTNYSYYKDRYFKQPVLLGMGKFYESSMTKTNIGTNIFTSFIKKADGHYLVWTNLSVVKYKPIYLIVLTTSLNSSTVDARGTVLAGTLYIYIDVYASDDNSLNDVDFQLMLYGI